MNERREGELLGYDDEGGVRRGSPFVWPSSSHTAVQPPRAARAIGPLSLGGGGTSCPSLAPYPHYTVYVRMNCSLPALAHMPASALPIALVLSVGSTISTYLKVAACVIFSSSPITCNQSDEYEKRKLIVNYNNEIKLGENSTNCYNRIIYKRKVFYNFERCEIKERKGGK